MSTTDKKKQNQRVLVHPAVRSVRKAFGLQPSPTPEPEEDEEERKKKQRRKRGSLADIISNNLKVLGGTDE